MRSYNIKVIVVEIGPDGTQATTANLVFGVREGAQASYFAGQEVVLPAAGGKAQRFEDGMSLRLVPTGAEKNRIHVGGIFEWKHPRFDSKQQPHDSNLGNVCISEVVCPRETLKVKLDMSEKKGIEYRVEIKVEEVQVEEAKEEKVGS